MREASVVGFITMTRSGADGLMAPRFASINDRPIAEIERKFRWLRPT